MTVFVVIRSHWDESEIQGVYSSLATAMAANEPLHGLSWTEGRYVEGLARGQSLVIEEWTLDGERVDG